jgi:hypothetical protein
MGLCKPCHTATSTLLVDTVASVSADLLKLLSIDESDLVANRAGRMGEHQQATQKTNARRLTLTGAGGGVLLALFAVLLVIQGGAWPLPLAVGAGWVGLCLALARSAARAETAAVYCLSGPVRVRKVTTDAGASGVPHHTLWLDVDGKSCLLPGSISFDLDRWRSALGPSGLRVYVYGGPKIPKVVGIEPVVD